MFADALCQMLIDYKVVQYVPFGLVAMKNGEFDPENTYLDEVIGFGAAAFGFSFQFFAGFTLPFPMNIIFLPLTFIEWFLRIQISMTDGSGVH